MLTFLFWGIFLSNEVDHKRQIVKNIIDEGNVFKWSTTK